MGNLTITSSKLNEQFNYQNEDLFVIGSCDKDASNDNALINLSGQVYRNNEGQQGDYVGNFMGYMRDGVMKYSISEMTRTDANKTWDAIDEIQADLTGQNAE